MLNLTDFVEQDLLHEMEALRRELEQLIQEQPHLLNSRQAYTLSLRLDTLIALYMKSMSHKEQA